MRSFRKVMFWALSAGIGSFLVIPLLIPFQTAGQLSNQDAASESLGKKAEFVKIADLDLHIEVANYSGKEADKSTVPLLVLLHGFGASTFSWRDVMVPLSVAGDVIAYDRPAFGFTERPTKWKGPSPYGFEGNFRILENLLKKFGEGREVILVGHSAGGQLAAEFARLNPGLVQKLALVDPAIYTSGGFASGFRWLFDIPQVNALGPFLVQGIATSGNDLLVESFYNKAQISKEVTDGYRAPLKVRGWELAFWNYTKASRDNNLRENLGDIEQPTLIITGEFDTVVPTPDTKKLATEISGSQLVVIPKTAHLPHEENPERFTRELLSWLGN